MELHLVWFVPMIIFVVRYLIEPRSVLNAYLFNGVVFLLLGVMSAFFIVRIENISREVAIGVAIMLAAAIPISVILSTIYLLYNGRQMITFEGMRFANLLSLFYGVLLVGTFLLHLIPDNLWSNRLVALLDFYVLYFSFLYVSYILYSIFYNRIILVKDVDGIVILGAGLIGDKVPPLLAQRLDRGISYYEKYNKKPLLIVSGGQGSDELISEAEAMKRYLVEKGIDESSILLENQSTTTRENLLYTQELIAKQLKKQQTLLVVTNSFHALRAGILMKRLGIKGRSVGSKTKLYYLPSAFMRETVALVRLFLPWHLGIVGGYTLLVMMAWFI